MRNGDNQPSVSLYLIHFNWRANFEAAIKHQFFHWFPPNPPWPPCPHPQPPITWFTVLLFLCSFHQHSSLLSSTIAPFGFKLYSFMCQKVPKCYEMFPSSTIGLRNQSKCSISPPPHCFFLIKLINFILFLPWFFWLSFRFSEPNDIEMKREENYRLKEKQTNIQKKYNRIFRSFFFFFYFSLFFGFIIARFYFCSWLRLLFACFFSLVSF